MTQATDELIERALLDDLQRQNPDMQTDPERDTVWLSGGATPQSCGTFINVGELAEAVAQALSRLQERGGVPARATNAMQVAGLKPLLAYLNDDTGTIGSDDLLADVWAAMLAAAPPLPSPPLKGEG